MNMPMGSALPDWVTPLSWVYIVVSLLSTAAIATDIYLGHRRHEGASTELVWVTAALYLGPFAIPAYQRYGRAGTAAHPAARSAVEPSQKTSADAAGPAALATLPGGGASAVSHLIAVPLVATVGWTIAGMAMWPMILAIAVLATAMLAVYEHTTRRPAAAPGLATFQGGPTLGAAVFAAVVTVVAFDVGMVGWMLVLHLNDLMPAVTEGAFWFQMQVGVVVGLATGHPAVKWLVARHQSAVPA